MPRSNRSRPLRRPRYALGQSVRLVQAPDEVQDTPASNPKDADPGSGVAWAAHPVPFHTSASGPEAVLPAW